MLRKILKVGVALGVVALSAWGALALSVDQTRNAVARVGQTQQTNYYRFTLNFNDAVIGTGQRFGQLLKNTYISKVACHTTTAFNAGTSNALQIGTSAVQAAASTVNWGVVNTNQSGVNMLIQFAGIQEASPTNSTALGTAVTSQNDVDLWARYVQTGTAATAGAVTCVIEYVPNNDM